jgi:Flp pilus assembly protein TadB
MMQSDLPILVVIASLSGIALAALVLGMRKPMLTLFEREVHWLERAVWRFSPEPFNGRPWVAGFYAAAVVIPIVWLWYFPFKIGAVLTPVLLLWLPRVIVEKKWEKRRKLIDQQLPACVIQMSQSVAAGMTLAQAVDRLAERGDEPIRTEFRVMSNFWKHGADFTLTIDEAKRRLGLPNFNLFASALLVNLRMGGNVVETLERLGQSIQGIERMKEEVYAATSEGRTNIKVIGACPFVMLGFTAIMDFEAVVLCFTRPVGWAMLSVAGALIAAGMLWAWRIVNADI